MGMAALPLIFSGLSTASSVQQGRDARKAQNEQKTQQERLLAEERANTPQDQRSAVAASRRRRGTGPGFSDAGAASLVKNADYGNTQLGA